MIDYNHIEILVIRFFRQTFHVATNSFFMTTYAFLCTIGICLICQLIAWKRGKKFSLKHVIKVYLFLGYLTMVYGLTGMGTIWFIGFYDTIIRPEQIYLIPFQDSTLIPLILNVMMTMPLGFFLPWIWQDFRSLKKVAWTGFYFSLAIELSQLLNLRNTMVDDLMMNTFGAILGYFIFKIINLIFRKNNDESLFPHEGTVYLVASFLTMFFLYDSIFHLR